MTFRPKQPLFQWFNRLIGQQRAGYFELDNSPPPAVLDLGRYSDLGRWGQFEIDVDGSAGAGTYYGSLLVNDPTSSSPILGLDADPASEDVWLMYLGLDPTGTNPDLVDIALKSGLVSTNRYFQILRATITVGITAGSRVLSGNAPLAESLPLRLYGGEQTVPFEEVDVRVDTTVAGHAYAFGICYIVPRKMTPPGV